MHEIKAWKGCVSNERSGGGWTKLYFFTRKSKKVGGKANEKENERRKRGRKERMFSSCFSCDSFLRRKDRPVACKVSISFVSYTHLIRRKRRHTSSVCMCDITEKKRRGIRASSQSKGIKKRREKLTKNPSRRKSCLSFERSEWKEASEPQNFHPLSFLLTSLKFPDKNDITCLLSFWHLKVDWDSSVHVRQHII